VSNAYNKISAGDIIYIPEGDCTWTSSLTIKKEHGDYTRIRNE
jgi:hypothetical protein